MEHPAALLLGEDAFDDPASKRRVLFDGLILGDREGSCLEEHGIRDSDLADVVNEGRLTEECDPSYRPPELARKAHRKRRHSLGVTEG